MQVIDATQSAFSNANSLEYTSKEKALESLLSAPVIFQEASNPASRGLGIPNGYKAINEESKVVAFFTFAILLTHLLISDRLRRKKNSRTLQRKLVLPPLHLHPMLLQQVLRHLPLRKHPPKISIRGQLYQPSRRASTTSERG